MKKRRNKTVSQQCKRYEVENIYEYMVQTYINGNISRFKELYDELCRDARREFIEYLFTEAIPTYRAELVLATI